MLLLVHVRVAYLGDNQGPAECFPDHGAIKFIQRPSLKGELVRDDVADLVADDASQLIIALRHGCQLAMNIDVPAGNAEPVDLVGVHQGHAKTGSW